MSVSIRAALPADAEAIRAIFNHAVLHTDAVYTETPRSAADQGQWLAEKAAAGLPVLVAVGDMPGDADAVLGFASYGPFRPQPGYRRSVESSVYVDPAAQRRGIGRALMLPLLEAARAAGNRAVLAGIDGANTASIALHAALGFRIVGQIPDAAEKFGRSLDLVLMRCGLEPNPPPSAGPDGVRVDPLVGRDLEAALPRLAEILAACVTTGASVNFVAPFDVVDARRWWDGVLPAVAAGRRQVLGAWHGDRLVGTVQLGLAEQPNQAHRGEIMKLLVDPAAQRRGIGAALLAAAEAAARAAGRTLLVLDTRSGDAGERLYRRAGWQFVGQIPGYARAVYDDRREAASLYFKQV